MAAAPLHEYYLRRKSFHLTRELPAVVVCTSKDLEITCKAVCLLQHFLACVTEESWSQGDLSF